MNKYWISLWMLLMVSMRMEAARFSFYISEIAPLDEKNWSFSVQKYKTPQPKQQSFQGMLSTVSQFIDSKMPDCKLRIKQCQDKGASTKLEYESLSRGSVTRCSLNHLGLLEELSHTENEITCKIVAYSTSLPKEQRESILDISLSGPSFAKTRIDFDPCREQSQPMQKLREKRLVAKTGNLQLLIGKERHHSTVAKIPYYTSYQVNNHLIFDVKKQSWIWSLSVFAVPMQLYIWWDNKSNACYIEHRWKMGTCQYRFDMKEDTVNHCWSVPDLLYDNRHFFARGAHATHPGVIMLWDGKKDFALNCLDGKNKDIIGNLFFQLGEGYTYDHFSLHAKFLNKQLLLGFDNCFRSYGRSIYKIFSCEALCASCSERGQVLRSKAVSVLFFGSDAIENKSGAPLEVQIRGNSKNTLMFCFQLDRENVSYLRGTVNNCRYKAPVPQDSGDVMLPLDRTPGTVIIFESPVDDAGAMEAKIFIKRLGDANRTLPIFRRLVRSLAVPHNRWHMVKGATVLTCFSDEKNSERDLVNPIKTTLLDDDKIAVDVDWSPNFLSKLLIDSEKEGVLKIVKKTVECTNFFHIFHFAYCESIFCQDDRMMALSVNFGTTKPVPINLVKVGESCEHSVLFTLYSKNGKSREVRSWCEQEDHQYYWCWGYKNTVYKKMLNEAGGSVVMTYDDLILRMEAMSLLGDLLATIFIQPKEDYLSVDFLSEGVIIPPQEVLAKESLGACSEKMTAPQERQQVELPLASFSGATSSQTYACKQPLFPNPSALTQSHPLTITAPLQPSSLPLYSQYIIAPPLLYTQPIQYLPFPQVPYPYGYAQPMIMGGYPQQQTLYSTNTQGYWGASANGRSPFDVQQTSHPTVVTTNAGGCTYYYSDGPSM